MTDEAKNVATVVFIIGVMLITGGIAMSHPVGATIFLGGVMVIVSLAALST